MGLLSLLGMAALLNLRTKPILCATQIKLFQKSTTSAEELPERQVVELPVSLYPEPRCTYQVRMHTAQGPLVNRQVAIGEMLFHIWACNYASPPPSLATPSSSPEDKADNEEDEVVQGRRGRDAVYCMMVHNCTISSQRGDAAQWGSDFVEIVDEFGCSAWPGILPQIKYWGDLRASMAVQTFALDFDKPAVFFKCNVRLLLKINGRCRRPQCAQLTEREAEEFRPGKSPLNFP